jgi:hypothetical protein
VKFTGQVRLPEIDHPGVPATILVEDDQIEVFLEGESLGRWSLNDVHASRLVSAAFSLALAGEEITFIADEPVDFAYKGVDHMAEVWARYRSMTVPRRMVAVGRSRRGTVPSRIEELRLAMLQNLETTGRRTARLAPVEVAAAAPASVIERWPRSVPEPADVRPVEEAAPPPPGPHRPAPTPAPKPDEEAPTAPPRPRLRPGAGLFARTMSPDAEPVMDPSPVFAPAPGVVEDGHPSPWDEPPAPVTPRVRAPFTPQVPPSDPPSTSPVDPDPVPLPEAAPEPAARADDSPVPPAQVPELIKELLSTSSDEGEGEGARDLVVDLGHYEGGRRVIPDPEPPALPKQPALTGAPSVETTERSGLFGAVRSAFARNKVVHEHEFVEAPGGIGIVRQICAECGYISIGVSD